MSHKTTYGCVEDTNKIFVFHRVIVSVTPGAAQIITWELNPLFRPKGPFLIYYIEFAHALGEWTRLNPDDALVNECTYVDDNKRRCGLNNDEYYRIIAFDGIQEYASKPEPTLGVWNRHDWLIARDVIRKEYLRLRKFVGAQGWLLKRRKGGIPCECNDWDTGEPVNSFCDACFGTGIQGGYYNAIPFWLDIDAGPKAGDVSIPTGVVDNRSTTARAVAYPRLDTYDIWIDGDMNKRYVIRKVDSPVDFRGKPVIYNLLLNQIPASGIEYSIPLEQSLEDIFGPAPSPDCVINPNLSTSGWRQGLGEQELC